MVYTFTLANTYIAAIHMNSSVSCFRDIYTTLSCVSVGCAGHGFKLSPVVGKLLCELALDLPPSHDLTPFRLDRFNKEQQP